MAYSNQPPIPLHRDTNQQKWEKQNQGNVRQEQRPPQKAKETFSGPARRDKPGRGEARPNAKLSGMHDPFDIDIAPMNIFENQVVPVGIHNLSKSFRPNMATIRVLSLGTKFIPKWRDANLQLTFQNFGDFNRKM